MQVNKNKIKKIIGITFWCLTGLGCIVLLASAVRRQNNQRCRGVEIEISGVNSNFFIDRNDVYAIVKNNGGDSTGQRTLRAIDLKRIERELNRAVWVKHAIVYLDNNNMLKVFVQEREPIARVFTTNGNSFYTDSTAMRLPLSDKFSARLPLFTDFPSDSTVLNPADSLLLAQVKDLALRISADSFLNALAGQVVILPNRRFEIIPTLGRQTIEFGDANDAAAKFEKLKLFYKNVITRAGWNRYRTIDLQYKDQVVAVIQGKQDIVSDSLQTLALLKSIAAEAAAKATDSTQTFLPENDKPQADTINIQQSAQRDDGPIAMSAQPTVVPAPAARIAAVVPPVMVLHQTPIKTIVPKAKAALKPPPKRTTGSNDY